MNLNDVAPLFVLVIGGICAMFLSIPIIAIWAYHRRKMEEIRIKGKVQIADDTQVALQQMSDRIESIRKETTDHYFDLEYKISSLETKIRSIESNANSQDNQNISYGGR